jgi:signal transduction histidine kinase/ligand-binding sensor domain-containing protein/CheY-like chemotaxis protein
MLFLQSKNCELFLAFLLIIFSFESRSQNKSADFEQLTIENGLSNSNIQTIYQDSKGFMWIGTQDGLNKFDGINFTVYHHIPGDSSSISENFIVNICEDKKGNLWVGTLNGLNIYDRITDKFKTINLFSEKEHSEQQTIYSLSSDNEANLWVGTDQFGVYKIYGSFENKPNSNLTTRKFNYKIKYIDLQPVFPEIKPEDIAIKYLYFDSKNKLWVGTNYYGLFALDFPNGINGDRVAGKRFFYNPHDLNSLSDNYVLNIVEDKFNTIWIGLYDGGINRIIPAAFSNSGKDEVMHFMPVINSIKTNKKLGILCMLEDNNENIWFGTVNEGLLNIRTSLETEEDINSKFKIFKNDPYSNKSIMSNQVNCLFEDKSGLIWTGTDVGISIYNKSKDNFNLTDFRDFFCTEKNVSVNAIVNDENYLWVASDDFGVEGMNKKTNKKIILSNRPGDPLSLSNNNVNALLKDKAGNIWIGTANGLNELEKSVISKFEASADSASIPPVKEFIATGKHPNELTGNLIFCMVQGPSGLIWVGTQLGVNYFHPDSMNFYSVLIDVNNQKGISNGIVRCLIVDNEQNIWIGTENGLNRLEKRNGIVTKYFNHPSDNNSLSNNRIASVYQSQDKTIWIGTNGGGLNRYDKTKNMFKCYTIQNGLPNSVINAIEEDKQGNLWLTTNNGLSKFNTKNETFTNYNVSDGLKSNGFNIGAAFKSFDGELFLGSIKGLNSFYPERITKNNFIPPIVITNFKIFDKSVFGPGFEKTKNTLLNDNFVQLDYNQNFFSFEFAALNYINSEKNQYKYMLQGVDAGWVNNGTRRFASYTNIDPGTYTFLVKGSNNDGVWNEKGTTITIKIIPPYYKTWWFRGVMAFVFAALIFFVTQIRIKAIRQTKEKEVIEHSARMKEQFLANMSHEIRTPMNAIVGMTRLLIEKEPRGDQKKYLNAIEQSSDNLLVIINDILDFSKIEAGKLELEYIPFSISALLDGVYNTMQFKIKEKGLRLSCEVSDDVPAAVSGDRVRLNEVFLNLVGNAVKFTHHGNIKVSCFNKGNCVDNNGAVIPNRVNIEFSVSDTGIGIPEDRLESIFESFSQASSDTTRKFGGTGLGLTISKHLVELHGGKISVTSQPGNGTVFTFVIPFDIADSSLIERENKFDENTHLQYLSRLKLLLTEDNEFNQMVAVDTLTNYIPGISIDIANNGKEAVDKVAAGNYDLILMDIQMPEMDGYTATQLIRKQLLPPKNEIKIMAMTAGALKSEIQKCYEAGMDDYISKPFDPHLLIEKMSTLFPDQNENMT